MDLALCKLEKIEGDRWAKYHPPVHQTEASLSLEDKISFEMVSKADSWVAISFISWAAPSKLVSES